MDGRRLRKVWFSGCLALGALGCHRDSVQPPWGQAPSGPSVPGVASVSNKSFWGSSGPTSGQAESTIEMTKKGPPKPETEVAIADVRLESAFDEKTLPGSRESLLDAARQGYQRALQRDPKNKEAMLGLARYYSRTGERDKAVEMYQKYLAKNPTDREVTHEVALAHARWKDWNGAVAWCDRALQIDPENLTFRKTKAFCLARGGQWDDSFKILCQIMPEAQARYDIACVMAHQNMPDACRQQLVLSMKADPNFGPAREFLAGLDQPAGPAADPNTTIQRAGYVEPQ